MSIRVGRHPRRRHDGRADRAALRQRRRAVAAARRDARRRAPGPGAGAAAQARPAVHARHAGALVTHRRLRRRPGRGWPTSTGSSRPWSNGSTSSATCWPASAPHCRRGRRSSAPTRRASRSAASPRAGRPSCRRALARHALLQPAALSAAARGDPDRRHRPGAWSPRWSALADRVLGKGVVVAKDTPNFIGNHLALHGVAAMLRAVEAGRFTIDEVDAITGRAIGRPALGHLPHDGHRRARRAGPRDAQPRGAAARPRAIARGSRRRRCCSGLIDRARWREGGQGLLRAAQGRGRARRRCSR